MVKLYVSLMGSDWCFLRKFGESCLSYLVDGKHVIPISQLILSGVSSALLRCLKKRFGLELNRVSR